MPFAAIRWMDGPTDCHTEWIKSDRERDIYMISLMWNLIKDDTKQLILKKQTHRFQNQS